MTVVVSKICTKCGLEKSTDDFYREARHRDGLRYVRGES